MIINEKGRSYYIKYRKLTLFMKGAILKFDRTLGMMKALQKHKM